MEVGDVGGLAADGQLIESGDIEEAGRLAISAGDTSALRLVVRSALSSHPPRVAPDVLRQWNASGLLAEDDPHRWWLEGGCRATRAGAAEFVVGRYQAARKAFSDAGDFDAEMSVGLAIGIFARRTNDVSALADLVSRARALAAGGDERAIAVSLMGDAVLLQLSGDPAGAVEVLESVPAGALEGDWAPQLSMLLGTNMMLVGRLEEAEGHLASAVGAGSTWSYATALRLLALVHWLQGRGNLALEDLETAADQARRLGAASVAADCVAIGAAMAALMGRHDAPSLRARASGVAALDGAGRVALDVARAAIAVADGDLVTARSIAADLPLPDHASPPAHWVVGLVGTLAEHRHDEIGAVVEAHPSLHRAWSASRAARLALDGGPPAGLEHAPYLPASWCVAVEPEVRIDLLGTPQVVVDGRRLEHPFWERGRVRELCLYLATVTGSSRAVAAERLWPDLDGAAAARNFRVTLANLLDVLDPDRRKGGGSSLVAERRGLISLVVADRLVIDVREERRNASEVVAAVAVADHLGMMAAARRLVRREGGALLDGTRLGEWADELDRDRRALLLRAVSGGAPVALLLGDHDLAEDLARRGLELDPWAERLHQVVVQACLARDDLDGARRGLRACIEALGDIDLVPEPRTVGLAEELGVVL